MKSRQDQTKQLLDGYITRHAVLTSVLSLARNKGLEQLIATKLIQMLDLPAGFFADNQHELVQWWLDFVLEYDHATDYGPIRLQYFEGDPARLELPRHTSLGGAA